MKRYGLYALFLFVSAGWALICSSCGNSPTNPANPTPTFTATNTRTPYADTQTTETPNPTLVHSSPTITVSPFLTATPSGWTPTVTPTPFAASGWSFFAGFGRPGKDGKNGDFEQAAGIAIGNGFIAVGDSSYGNVQVFNNTGGYLYSITLPGNNFQGPYGMAMDSNGELYVATSVYYNGEVVGFYLGSGGYTYDYTWTGQGALISPHDVKVDPQGNLVVCDQGNGAVYNLAWADDSVLRVSTGNPSGYRPVGVALDAAGNLYVGDYASSGGPSSGRIVQYGGNYAYTGTITGSAWTLPLGWPVSSLVPDSQGNFFVSDTGNDRVVYMTPQGGYLGGINGFGWADYLALDSAGDLFIVDSDSNQIDEFTR